MGSIMKFISILIWDHFFEPLSKLLSSFRSSKGSHWKSKISIVFFVAEGEFISKIDENPRKNRILSKIAVRATSKVVDLLKVLEVADLVVYPFLLQRFDDLS